MGDTLVTAIGQGYDLVTPLQLVNATAAVANGGTLYRPKLVMNVTDPSGKVIQDYKPEVLGKLPVSPENINIVREGMRQVVADKKGTAYNRITLRSVSVAGKTGTAEYCDDVAFSLDQCEFGNWPDHAWFTAYAPYEAPDNPELHLHTDQTSVAEAVAQILDFLHVQAQETEISI